MRGFLSLFLLSLKMVFTRALYIGIATGVTAIFWVFFNVLDELLFFSPVFVFYLPDDAITSFMLSNVTAPQRNLSAPDYRFSWLLLVFFFHRLIL
jgi:hypothetical protein